MKSRYVSLEIEKCRAINVDSRCAPDRLIDPFIDDLYVSVYGIFDYINTTVPNIEGNRLFQYSK